MTAGIFLQISKTINRLKRGIQAGIGRLRPKNNMIIDDIGLELNQTKLEENKENNMPPAILAEKSRSYEFGIVGTGQAGSRLAERFYALGYQTVVMNTATQDLAHIQVPEENKLLLKYGAGGAAKNMEIGREAAASHQDEIQALLADKLADADVFVLCFSLGGGSGAGSSEVILQCMATLGKPIVCICVLPMTNDDAQTKNNSVETLAALSKMAQNKQIQSLICVDNAKLESIFSGVGQLSFFKTANQAIVEPIDAFNCFSKQASPVKSLDSMEWATILLDGEGCTIFATMDIEDYEGETAISDAIMSNLNNNLLASGFDLKQTKYAGFVLVSSQEILDQVPSSAINYARNNIEEFCGVPKSTFHGVYISEAVKDGIKIYSCFAGLGLPSSRIESLKEDAKSLMERVKEKEGVRNAALTLDNSNDAMLAAQKQKAKIAQKSSPLGKFMTGQVNKK